MESDQTGVIRLEHAFDRRFERNPYSDDISRKGGTEQRRALRGFDCRALSDGDLVPFSKRYEAPAPRIQIQ
jgi:hypothetical protein